MLRSPDLDGVLAAFCESAILAGFVAEVSALLEVPIEFRVRRAIALVDQMLRAGAERASIAAGGE